MIFNKEGFLKKTESIGTSMDLWKALKSLGLPNEIFLMRLVL